MKKIRGQKSRDRVPLQIIFFPKSPEVKTAIKKFFSAYLNYNFTHCLTKQNYLHFKKLGYLSQRHPDWG
jgi:hypothetical protein